MFMKHLMVLLLANVALAFIPAQSHAQITINEIRIDQPGTDTDEFIEIHSSDGSSLAGLSFVILQDNGSIDDVVDLSSFTIAANDVLLIAEVSPLPTSGATPDFVDDLSLENGENAAYLIVSNLTGAVGDDLDADDDGVFDAALPWDAIVDGVALIDDDPTILDGGDEDINYGPALGIDVVGPDGTFYPGYVFASADGAGIDSIGAFDPIEDGSTPGELNGGDSGDACPSGFEVGDVNMDGIIDLLDVGPFVNSITTGVFQCEADVDGSGAVDLLDVGPFVDLLTGG